MPAPRVVTGNIAILSGEAREGIEIVFRRKGGADVFGQYGKVVVNEPLRAVSGPGGAFSITLFPGTYDIHAAGSNGIKRGVYSLSEDGSDDFADGVGQASSIPITPSLVAQAAGYRDEAEDARDAAAADRAQTGLDRIATAADRTQVAADRAATGADRAQTAADRLATAADRAATGADRLATAADRAAIETNLLVYVTDDAQSLTIAVSDTMVVAESTSPYPTVTLEFATP